MSPRTLLALALLGTLSLPLTAAPQIETLDRGLAAVQKDDGKVFLSWRLLATDPEDVAFNVYRETGKPGPEGPVDFGIYGSNPDIPDGLVKLNDTPLTAGTWFIDTLAGLQRETRYFVRPVVRGKERDASRPIVFAAGSESRPYHAIRMSNPPGYTPTEGSVGDLDGDGQYEIVLIQNGRAFDNSKPGPTDPPILQAYKLDGTLLWNINLGPNIRAGAHYTQFMVFDLDGDGKAEIACKTADGTVDGNGVVIGDAKARHADERGHVLKGPEFLTVFDGMTGAALDTVKYVPGRHPEKQDPSRDELKAVWGDGNGNRSERYTAGIAYLDGKRPSLIMARGYYTRATIAAWDFRKGKLKFRWLFDSDDGTEGNRAYRGHGNHQLSVADVDNDGKHEIVYGAAVIDDNGKGLYSTGWGHGDTLHVGDLVPSNPGLEVMTIQERFDKQGISLRDGATGKPIFTVPSVKANEDGGDKGEGPGRGVAFDIDPRFPGAEVWAIGAGMKNIFRADGTVICERPQGMPANFAVWWDGDTQRELLDQNFICKWNPEKQNVDRLLTAHNCISSNGTKATPFLSADLWGDWREEVIWHTRDSSELRIYTTTIPTPYRLTTLMQDPQYRCAIAWQNVAYNQPPHPSFAIEAKVTEGKK